MSVFTHISELRQEFNKSANPNLKSYIAALEKNGRVIDAINGTESKPAREHSFVFLVDGSASMRETLGGISKSRLSFSISSLAAFHTAAPLIDRASIANGYWGGNRGVTWFNKSSLNSASSLKKLSAGPGYKSELAPAVRELTFIAGQTKEANSKRHIVIVGDGAFDDPEQTKKNLVSLLSNNADVTVDFAIIGNCPGEVRPLQKLAAELRETFPAQVGISTSTLTSAMKQNIFTRIVSSRINDNQPKKKKAAAPKHG